VISAVKDFHHEGTQNTEVFNKRGKRELGNKEKRE
jgi:hypothetical protein